MRVYPTPEMLPQRCPQSDGKFFDGVRQCVRRFLQPLFVLVVFVLPAFVTAANAQSASGLQRGISVSLTEKPDRRGGTEGCGAV